MKKSLLSLALIIFYFNLSFSQDDYFQQKADYYIYANLNPTYNTLDGYVDITYHNNSKNTLNEIYLYLHPNQYKSNNTLLADEFFKREELGLYFANPKDFGGYIELSFVYGEQALNGEYYNKDKSIVKINIDNKLYPGDSMKIKVNYLLDIPKDIDGLGYNGKQFNFANWYPKVLAYDKNGWNLSLSSSREMLNSEFGDYVVNLRLPEDLIVASSGILQTEKEINFLKENIINIKKENMNYRITNVETKYKTLKYEAKNITDFAWSTNPLFTIKQDIIRVDETQNIKLNLYLNYKLIKKNRTKQIDSLFRTSVKSIKFYLKEIGTYPSNQISIIATDNINGYYKHSSLLLVSLKKDKNKLQDKSTILSHNLADTWINSFFTTNSFENAWVKNSLGGLYHTSLLYNDLKTHKKNSIFKAHISRFNHLAKFKSATLEENEYLGSKDKFIFTVCKPAISFYYLKNYMGDNKFNGVMKSFFYKWKFKHITSDDIKNHFERSLNKDLSWLFDGLIVDPDPFKYSIENLIETDENYLLNINNEGKFNIPFQVGGIKDDSLIYSDFIEGFSETKSISLPKKDFDKIIIDPIDLFYKNSKLKSKVIIHHKYHYPNWLSFFKEDNPTNVVLPIIAYNKNDGLMTGIFLHSKNTNDYNYTFIPMYGFKSKSLVGTLNYERITNSPFNTNKLQYGINVRRFHRLRNIDKGINLKYSRISPYINLNLGNNEFNTKSKLTYKFSFIVDESLTREGVKPYNRYINNLDYFKKGGSVIAPYKFNIGLEHQLYNYYEKEQYVMIHYMLKSSYMYKKDRFLSIRLFGASYLYNTNKFSTGTNPGTLSLIGSGGNDYSYNKNFINRSEQSGFWSRQLMMNTGGFKTAIGNSYGIGQSNNYVLSANIKMDLPMKLFIKPYLDIGIYGDLPTISDGYFNKVIYSAGLVFQVIKNRFEIYLPLLNSEEINNAYNEKDGSILNRISFMIDFNYNKKDLSSYFHRF